MTPSPPGLMDLPDDALELVFSMLLATPRLRDPQTTPADVEKDRVATKIGVSSLRCTCKRFNGLLEGLERQVGDFWGHRCRNPGGSLRGDPYGAVRRVVRAMLLPYDYHLEAGFFLSHCHIFGKGLERKYRVEGEKVVVLEFQPREGVPGLKSCTFLEPFEPVGSKTRLGYWVDDSGSRLSTRIPEFPTDRSFISMGCLPDLNPPEKCSGD